MEVKPGYKQTEVGVVPEEWETAGLGRFWSVTDCKHLTAQFVPQGYPLASIREVQSRFVDLSNAKQTTAKFYNLLIEGGRKPCPGDLILSRNATVGEVAQVAEWHPPFAMGQDVCLLRKKSPGHSTEFLQAVFQSPVILNQLANLMVGSTFKRANVEQIRNLSVSMPEPPEQRAIAEVLSDVDRLLEALDRLIVKKRDLKQAAMQQLLTPSESWTMVKLEHIADVIDPHPSHRAPDAVPNGIPFVGIGDLGENGEIVGTALRLVAPSVYDEHLARYDLADGLIGLGRVASIGKVVRLRPSAQKYAISPTLGVIRATKVSREYLLCSLRSKFVTEQFNRIMSGSTRSSVGMVVLRKLNIALPADNTEQIAIAEVLSDMDAELGVLEQRREKTRTLKQGMMQELLTGRTRLI